MPLFVKMETPENTAPSNPASFIFSVCTSAFAFTDAKEIHSTESIEIIQMVLQSCIYELSS
jgi:hypothetical protein